MGNWRDTEVYKTIQLAIPIIMGELAQMSLHLIDTAMVGAISYKHLAAASLVMTAANIPFVIGIGMTISVSQMVSMANGRRDHQLISHYLFNGFILCTAFALIISAGSGIRKEYIKTSGPGSAGGYFGTPFYGARWSFDYSHAVIHDTETVY